MLFDGPKTKNEKGRKTFKIVLAFGRETCFDPRLSVTMCTVGWYMYRPMSDSVHVPRKTPTNHGSIIAPWTYPLSSARGSQARLRQTSTLVGDDSGSLGVELSCSFFSYCYWKATCQWMLAFSFHTACFMFYLIVFIFCLSLKRTLLHSMPTQCPLLINVHWIRTQGSSGADRQKKVEWVLNVNWMWTEGSLNLHWMCTECELNVNWI